MIYFTFDNYTLDWSSSNITFLFKHYQINEWIQMRKSLYPSNPWAECLRIVCDPTLTILLPLKKNNTMKFHRALCLLLKL